MHIHGNLIRAETLCTERMNCSNHFWRNHTSKKTRAMGQNHTSGYSAFSSLVRKSYVCPAPSSPLHKHRQLYQFFWIVSHTIFLLFLFLDTPHPQEVLPLISSLSGEPTPGEHTHLAILLPICLTCELARAQPLLKTLREHHKE